MVIHFCMGTVLIDGALFLFYKKNYIKTYILVFIYTETKNTQFLEFFSLIIYN